MQSHQHVPSDCHIAPLFALTSRCFGRSRWSIQH